MKKRINYLLVLALFTFSFMTKVNAEGRALEQVMKCEKGVMANISFLLGIALLFIRIAVPIILIVMISIDLFNSLTDDSAKVDMKKIYKRVISAILVFLAPSIISMIMGIVGNTDYEACYECIKGPFGDSCRSDYKNNL